MRNVSNCSPSVITDNELNLDIVNTNMRMAVLPVTILIGIENFIGLMGNILILIVYSKRYEKSNFRYFVLFMAFIDLTSCLTCVPGELFSQLNWYKYEYAWICKIKSYFNVLGAWGSASILLLLAFDRHRKICRPLNWQIQPSLALKLCSSAVVISVCVSAPILVLWGKQTYVYDNGDFQVNVSVCEKAGEFDGTIYPFLYITCVYILPVGVMMVIITTLNFLTAKRLFFDRDRSLTEILTMTSARSNNNSSQTSLETLSESVSMQDIHTTITTQPGSVDNMAASKRPVTTQRISAELTDYNDGSRSTSVTVMTRNDAPVDHVSGNNRAVCSTPNINQNSQTNTSTRTSRDHSSLRISTSTLASSRDVHSRTGRRDGSSVKRKTIIMLVLTTVFVITMSLYVILISLIAEQNILQTISNSEKALYFLFLRLYFINCVINPFLYGLMDPRFCKGVKHMICKKCKKC